MPIIGAGPVHAEYGLDNAVAALIGIALTLSLGFWQWGRGSSAPRCTRRSQRAAASPRWPSPNCRRTLDADDPLLHRRAVLQGEWLPAHTVFLDNRQMNGVPGFYVLTPLRLQGRNDVVLVQRGWVQRNFARRERPARRADCCRRGRGPRPLGPAARQAI
jgi:surfeit locus 1 family protein